MAHILLLEPNQLLAGQYQRFFEDNGHDVTWCQNAQNGINLADNRKPDIVVMELLLTAHSGIEFLYEFRSYSEWRSIPIIILTRVPRNDISSSDKVLEELGVVAFLYKPETTLRRLGERLEVGLNTAATR